MTTLIIARHGNTFTPDQIPTRVGARTDLSLVESGIEQAQKLGSYLKDNSLTPTKIYTSTLQRTLQTAQHAQEKMDTALTINPLPIFDEIDYGPDENKTEDIVISRIGQHAIDDWNNEGTVPDGWQFDPKVAIENWIDFGESIKSVNETIFVVTSNGIARFAPYLTDNFENFRSHYPLKLSTGAFGILNYNDSKWTVKDWNVKP